LGASALPGDPALAALAALAGAGAIAALQVLIGWGLWRALQLGALRGRPRALALPLALLLLAHGPGWALALAPGRGGDGVSENVMVVQPAIPTRHKFEAGSQRRLLEQLDQALGSLQGSAALASGAPAGPGAGTEATVVVLPEAAPGTVPLAQLLVLDQLPLVDVALLVQLPLWAEAVGIALSTKTTAVAARRRFFFMGILGKNFPPQIPPPRPQNKSGGSSKRRRKENGDWQRIGERGLIN
jgi:apolipoprotein N-acyltransferase